MIMRLQLGIGVTWMKAFPARMAHGGMAIRTLRGVNGGMVELITTLEKPLTRWSSFSRPPFLHVSKSRCEMVARVYQEFECISSI